ncbi:AraC family transcriptional regulator [Fictibacillus sp. KU28468]|uniref:AraC family transcriptional regulator n=1 Tax=Fictibacillus sp. KU28468 TaxID=2991053 RepID=UPI00223D7460|nr:GyrI-like domain-containing protein [Fictibacillus sp. KU28468]UZJ81162.1 GyrI-like domain-containing protein [Fictibacillus sp. KU28468]
MTVAVKELPEHEVAYVRRVGSYFEPPEHWGKLFQWAFGNELFPPQQQFIGISLDNPELVEDQECRHDACVTIPKDFQKEEHPDDSFKRLDGGSYAVYSFYDTPGKLNQAYQFMFAEWLPASEYEPDFSRHNLEFNLNNPAEDPEGRCKVELFVPIKKCG